MKDTYKLLVMSQMTPCNFKFEGKQYIVEYLFEFKQRPLDASNCVAMVKLIEDVIFASDKWDIVKKISIVSMKGASDIVTIIVHEYDL